MPNKGKAIHEDVYQKGYSITQQDIEDVIEAGIPLFPSNEELAAHQEDITIIRRAMDPTDES